MKAVLAAALLVLLCATSPVLSAEKKTVYFQDFEACKDGKLPPGVFDNSAWKDNSQAELELIDPKRRRNEQALKIKVRKFAQVSLGDAPLQEGKKYKVSCDLSTSVKGSKVTLQLRKYEAPYTVYGSETFVLTKDKLDDQDFAFVCSGTNPRARLFLIIEMDEVDIVVDNIQIVEYDGK